MKHLPPPLTMEMLARFVQGQLDASDSALILQLAMENPAVAEVVDVLKREFVAQVILETKQMDPAVLIESGDLEAYITGDLHEAQRNLIELASTLHPEVAAELDALEALQERFALETAASPKDPAKARQRFHDFLDVEVEGIVDGLIRPPFIHAASTAAEFTPWVSQFGASPAQDYENVFVQPLHPDPECLTLLVWAKSEIAMEVHLDSIEKFLVLEGSCKIDIEGEMVHLQAGDTLSIPKFKAHTVFVTSSIPCKLVVQQIAA